jgi:hypothetical protein
MIKQLWLQIKYQYFSADAAPQSEYCLALHHERIPCLELLPLHQ